MRLFILLTVLYLIPSTAVSHSNYVGYSGAPGSNGVCSSSCHGQRSFVPSVTVTGFPQSYEPGQQYTILVNHTSHSAINQFNASVRVGTDSEIAGIISAGENTETYQTDNETNGIRWAAPNTDSGTFIWTAPSDEAGEVRLYWAGLQGTRAFGADTNLVIISNGPPSDIEYLPGTPGQFSMNQNYPNPFNNHTIVEIAVAEAGQVDFIITNILGQLVYEWRENVTQTGIVNIRWDGKKQGGGELPSGVYFYRLTSKAGTITKKMMLLR